MWDDYSYTLYQKGKEPVTDLVVHDGSKFSLADGEYIIIEYLPVGSKYIIEETPSELYDTSTSTVHGKDESKQTGVYVEGVIESKERYEVVFTNHRRFKLPETGGPGNIPFVMGGILVISTCIGSVYILKKKREKKAA